MVFLTQFLFTIGDNKYEERFYEKNIEFITINYIKLYHHDFDRNVFINASNF